MTVGTACVNSQQSSLTTGLLLWLNPYKPSEGAAGEGPEHWDGYCPAAGQQIFHVCNTFAS